MSSTHYRRSLHPETGRQPWTNLKSTRAVHLLTIFEIPVTACSLIRLGTTTHGYSLRPLPRRLRRLSTTSCARWNHVSLQCLKGTQLLRHSKLIPTKSAPSVNKLAERGMRLLIRLRPSKLGGARRRRSLKR